MSSNPNAIRESGLSPEAGPYTTPAMQANLFFRVFLGILANICCWVPMTLLWRNGEFAATVFCLTIMVLNSFYTVNALIWQDDNTALWWMGYGWCDIQVYTFYALDSLYTACVFEIMRQLANKVVLSRVTSLTRSERRRRHLMSALVIFPLPILQIIVTYFIQSQRYSIGPLIGCLANYDSTLPYLVTFVIPPPILTIGAAVFAGLTWKRFRDVDQANRNVLSSSGSETALRQARVRRKLYFLTLSILVPYLIVQFLFLVSNITSQSTWDRPYNYTQIRHSPPPNQWTGIVPDSWNSITFVRRDQLDFASLNLNYVPILTAIPLFISFGATKEAINTYRVCLLKLGLGTIWPRLREEYDPDGGTRDPMRSAWSFKVPCIMRRKNKDSALPTTKQVSLSSQTRSSYSAKRTGDLTFATVPVDLDEISPATRPLGSDPWPDLSKDPITKTRQNPLPDRNPWLTRTTTSYPAKLPPVLVPNFLKINPSNALYKDVLPSCSPSRRTRQSDGPPDGRSCGGETEHWWTDRSGRSRVRTHVWSTDIIDVESDVPHEAAERNRSSEEQLDSERVRVDTQIVRSSAENLGG